MYIYYIRQETVLSVLLRLLRCCCCYWQGMCWGRWREKKITREWNKTYYSFERVYLYWFKLYCFSQSFGNHEPLSSSDPLEAACCCSVPYPPKPRCKVSCRRFQNQPHTFKALSPNLKRSNLWSRPPVGRCSVPRADPRRRMAAQSKRVKSLFRLDEQSTPSNFSSTITPLSSSSPPLRRVSIVCIIIFVVSRLKSEHFSFLKGYMPHVSKKQRTDELQRAFPFFL